MKAYKMLATGCLALWTASSAPAVFAENMQVESKGGLEVFSVGDDDFWFKVKGRLNVDTAIYGGNEFDKSGYPSGSRIRRARMVFSGGIGDDWLYKIDLDFENGGGSVFDEVFIGYNGFKNAFVAIGQVSMPFGLDNWTGSDDIFLMERALPMQAFAPDGGIGIYGEVHGRTLAFAGAVYHPRDGETQIGDATAIFGAGPAGPRGPIGGDPLAIGGRLTFSPIHRDGKVYHFGVSFRTENVHDRANMVNFTATPEIRARSTPALSTLIPTDTVQDFQVYGFEAAGQWGAFVLSGEYVHTHVTREDYFPIDDRRYPGGNASYHGYYVQAAYVITGEHRQYNFTSGTFGPVKAKSSKGAWEVVARHSFVNLKDGLLGDGGAHATTLGVTWWFNDNIRFMANYSRAGLPFDRDLDIFGLRAQAKWG